MTPSILLVLDIYVIDANGSWHCLFMMRGLVWIRIVQTVHLIWHGTYSWAKVCNYSAAVLVRIWVHLLEMVDGGMVECVGRSPFTWSTFQHIWPNHNSNPTLMVKFGTSTSLNTFRPNPMFFFVFFFHGDSIWEHHPIVFNWNPCRRSHWTMAWIFSALNFEIRNARKKKKVVSLLFCGIPLDSLFGNLDTD